MPTYEETSPHPKQWNTLFLKIAAAWAVGLMLLGFSLWMLTHPPEGNIPPAPIRGLENPVQPALELLESQTAQLRTDTMKLHKKEQQNLLAHIERAAGIRGWSYPTRTQA